MPKKKIDMIACDTVEKACQLIEERNLTDDAIKHIYVDGDMAEKFLIKMCNSGGRYYVAFLQSASPLAEKLRRALHWDNPVAANDSYKIINVIKGNHNLRDNLPLGYQKIPSPVDDVALYLSDVGGNSYSDICNDPDTLLSIVQAVVMDYMRNTDNAPAFIYDYMQNQKRGCKEITAWCLALKNVYVKNTAGHYINGFTTTNIQDYKRQNEFIP